jgi:hypothetical protein
MVKRAPGPLTFRRFEPADARRMQRIVVTGLVMGVTAETEDGRIAGYGGIFRYADRRHWGFFNVFDERYRTPMNVHRITRDIVRIAVDAGIRIHVICNMGHPRADAWMRALGFRPMEDAEKDDGIRELEADHCARLKTENRTYVHDGT